MIKITPQLGYASMSCLPTPNFTGNFSDDTRSRKQQAFIQSAKKKIIKKTEILTDVLDFYFLK